MIFGAGVHGWEVAVWTATESGLAIDDGAEEVIVVAGVLCASR